MNKTPEEAQAFVRTIVSETKPEEQKEMVVLPSALVAHAVADAAKESKIRWGGQNCYFENKGAFTGENSPMVLAEMGASFCLVGHSERRQIFFESDEMLALKLRAVQASGMTPILCVGETLDDRRWRRTKEVVGRQLKSALASADSAKSFWLAYEPVWAIGTGQVATPEQVEEVHAFLRATLTGLAGTDQGSKIPILYGGSVKAENAGGLRALPNVSGFLIGGASLETSEFLKIHRSAL